MVDASSLSGSCIEATLIEGDGSNTCEKTMDWERESTTKKVDDQERVFLSSEDILEILDLNIF